MIRTISIVPSSLDFFFNFLSHAFLKDLLFVCAGCVIHSIRDSQDIRFISGLSVYVGSP